MAGSQRIMQLTVKMRRPNDSVKWGFRISGGQDYPEPLKITKIVRTLYITRMLLNNCLIY